MAAEYPMAGPDTTLEEQTKSTEVRPPNPRDSMAFWARELTTAKKRLEPWHRQAVKIVERYLDDRPDTDSEFDDGVFRLNLFHSNVATMEALLYGSLPKVQVARRHLDANDDPARIAALLTERVLNNDLQENGKERDAVLHAVLQDRLLPGLGCARVRYTFDTEMIEVPGMIGMDGLPVMQEQTVNEQAPVDYYYWHDVLWGWGRSWADLPWLAYRAWLSKEEVRERFPEFVDDMEYVQQPMGEEKDTDETDSPHHKAEIWEIWDRAGQCVYWYHKGCPELLDHKDDPLGLSGFFPSPPFLIANPTTMLYKPTPDYTLYQDLYNEIDTLQTRINIITEAVKVVGVYDSNADGVQRMLKEGSENDLIPVDSWAMFAEKGGIRGAVDWLPLEAVVNALDKLRQLRDDTIGLLQRTTGMADVMSGQVNPYEGVGQSELKTAWGSVRVQALQDDFASFVSNLLQLQAEVICKHFEPQTILDRANAQFLAEPPENIGAAMELLRSPQRARLRIEVKAEAVAQVDQQRVQAERAEFLNAMSTYMQSMAPMIQQEPSSMPYLLQMLQWVLSGFRGAAEIEGVLDKAIAESIQKAQQAQEKPDPEQQKMQMEMQKIQMKAQADMETRQADLQADLAEIQANSEARIQEIMTQHQARMKEIQAKGEADLIKERINLQANMTATTEAAAVETEKDMIRIDKETEAELRKLRASDDDDS